MAHLLFAPERPWKILPPGYKRIHAQLRREIELAKQDADKQVRHRRQSRKFKQTGDVRG